MMTRKSGQLIIYLLATVRLSSVDSLPHANIISSGIFKNICIQDFMLAVDDISITWIITSKALATLANCVEYRTGVEDGSARAVTGLRLYNKYTIPICSKYVWGLRENSSNICLLRSVVAR